MGWCQTFTCCSMTTTVVLGNASTMSHNYHFSSAVRTVKTESLGSSGVLNAALLTVITMLYISTLESVTSL